MKKLFVLVSIVLSVLYSCKKETPPTPVQNTQNSAIDTFVYVTDQVNVHDLQNNTYNNIQWGASTTGDMVVYYENSNNYIKNVAYPLYNDVFICSSVNPLVFGGYTNNNEQVINCSSYMSSDTLHLHYEMSSNTAYYIINSLYVKTY